MLYEFFYTFLFISEVVSNRLYSYFHLALLENSCIFFNTYNVKVLKKKINLGFSEIFSPSFQENNLLFNAFALKALVKFDPRPKFNFKKKDFIKDHKIYKINLNNFTLKDGFNFSHKLGNTVLSGLVMKKMSFKLNSFSKIKKFSFLIEGCLRNPEVSVPAFRSKYSTHYDVGFLLNSEISFFFEFFLKNCQIPLHLQEYKHFSYNIIRKNALAYSI